MLVQNFKECEFLCLNALRIVTHMAVSLIGQGFFGRTWIGV